jgi:FG-GAP repeat protein
MATDPLRAPERLFWRLGLVWLAVALAPTAAPGQPRGSAMGTAKALLPGTIELSALSGPGGFRLNGISLDDFSGTSVSGAGDVNGDGFDDLLIGAIQAEPNGPFSGQSYVVYGGSALPGTVELSALSGPDGFRLNGVSLGDRSGVSVSGAGDVNGDGFDDILIGADLAGLFEPGQSYVVYGGSALPETVELSALSGPDGFRINGIASSQSGFSVSGAGDVNGDGFDDLLIGAFSASPNGINSGQSYVVYGGSALSGTVELSALSGPDGFRVNGISSSDFSGFSVSGAGDVNGDGFDDLLIGAQGASPNGNSDSGQSYVVYGGSAQPGTVELSALSGSDGFRINGISSSDLSGFSVSGAGDVNGDGFDDLLIGARAADPNGLSSGQSYVVYGASALPGTVELSALSGANGFRLNGVAPLDQSGWSASGAGDVNGDGFDDVVIGASFAGPNGLSSGQSYLVYGGSALAGTVELSTLNGTNGFRLNGIAAGDESGFSVSGAGDVNGDGFDDLLIGAPRADPNGSGSGQSYLVYGAGAGPPAIPTLGWRGLGLLILALGGLGMALLRRFVRAT